jgi:hypothetical protein
VRDVSQSESCVQALSRVLEVGQATRPISIRQLHALPHVHLGPINLVVYKGSLGAYARDTWS